MKPAATTYQAHGLIFSFPAKDLCRIQSAEAPGAVQTLAGEFDGHVREPRLPLAVKYLGPRRGAVIRPRGSRYVLRVSRKSFKAEFRDAVGKTVCTLVDARASGSASSVAAKLGRGEFICGLGQRFDGVSQRGKRFRIWAEDRWNVIEDNSYVPIPFYLSTAGYGLFLNRFEAAEFDVGKARPDRIAVDSESPVLDLYVFLGADPRAITSAFARLLGRTPMPPAWSFEPWVCRHDRLKELSTPEKVRAVVERMRENRFPWGVMILEGWNTYDASTWDGLREIVAELHAAGKKAMVYEACGRLPRERWAEHGAKEEYFIRNLAGGVEVKEAPHYNPGDAPDRRTSVFLDVTHPDATDWWLNGLWGRLLGDIALDGAKIDFNEEIPEDGIRLAGRDGLKGLHQYYPVRYNILMYRNFNAKRPEGGVHFSRGGGIGSNRYHFIWMGDQSREWSRLRAIVSASLSSGLSGIPFMAHDLGGYIPKRKGIEDNETDVFIRGIELAVFSPIVEIHGTVPWPWEFPEEVRAIYRFYMELRYAMLPYLAAQARKCVRDGMPLMRHLLLEYPRDRRARTAEDEYLFGEDLLVAPVLDPGERRDVYLPAGEWVDIWTGKRLRGPRTVAGFEAKMDRIAVFAKTSSLRAPGVRKILQKTTGRK